MINIKIKNNMNNSVKKLILTYIFLAVCFFSTMIATAQVDTLEVNNAAESTLSVLFYFLVNKYPLFAPFTGIVTAAVMFIVRFFEKRAMKRKIAFSIKTVVEKPSDTSIPDEHKEALNNIIETLKK
jgi:hypothetical protein